MEMLILIIAIALGYGIGLLQGGIHIYTGNKPLAPSAKVQEPEEPQYNPDFSSDLPQEVQDYFVQNSGHIK